MWTARAITCGVLLVVGVHTAPAGINVWTSTGLSNHTVTALAIDPSTPSTLYAGTLTYQGGVFQSTDSGGSWSAVNTGLIVPQYSASAHDVYALAIDPQHAEHALRRDRCGRLPEHQQRRQLERGQHRPARRLRRPRAGHRPDHAEHALRRDVTALAAGPSSRAPTAAAAGARSIPA